MPKYPMVNVACGLSYLCVWLTRKVAFLAAYYRYVLKLFNFPFNLLVFVYVCASFAYYFSSHYTLNRFGNLE